MTKYGIEFRHSAAKWALLRVMDKVETHWGACASGDEPRLFDTVEEACDEIRRHAIAYPNSRDSTSHMLCRIVKVSPKTVTIWERENL